jgi:hypothetical protein
MGLCPRKGVRLDNNGSIYIGGVPWETLREMIIYYEDRIAQGRFGVKGVVGAGTKKRINTLRKIAYCTKQRFNKGKT